MFKNVTALLLYVAPLVVFAQSGSITGKIFDAETKQPLAGANVMIVNTTFGTATNNQGSFLISGVSPGEYKLQASFIGFKSQEHTITIVPEDTQFVNLFLEPVTLKGLEIVVSGDGSRNQAIERETPVAFNILSQKELESNYTTGDLPELIKNVPGVWSTTAGLGESDIFVRGFAADDVKFMINGIPMNEQDSQQLYWSNWAGLSNSVSFIQVQRGPGFSSGGSGGFGGTIKIESMRVASKKGTIVRTSVGAYKTRGIVSGTNKGKIADGTGGLSDGKTPVNYSYYVRHNSGPLYNGKLNISAMAERKTGDSYVQGTNYDGYAFGLEVASNLQKHRLRFSFMVAPQFHNQALALQDIELLDTIGREYNLRNHEWQENSYFKPFWSLLHQWDISAKQNLTSQVFFTLGRGHDQSLANGVFDVETGEVGFQPISRVADIKAFGRHARYLYENFDILMDGFYPPSPGSPTPFYGDYEVSESANFFSDHHGHSWQNRRRREHNQLGAMADYMYVAGEKLDIEMGGSARHWRGTNSSETWKLRMSNALRVFDGQLITVERLQKIFDFNTDVTSLSGYGRVKMAPWPSLTLHAGGQLYHSSLKVHENPINFYDFTNGGFMNIARRTTADQVDTTGTLKFSDHDYNRSYLFVTPWLGMNWNITDRINLFVNYATAKKEPAVADWYDFTEGPAASQNGEQKLQPESTNSVDIGIGYLTSGIRLRANYYRTRYSDKIESVLDFLDRRNTINAGNAIFQGVEVEAAAAIGRFDFSTATTISRNRWQEIKVNEIFGSHPDDVIGKVVPFSPEQTVFASVAYNTDNYKFKLGLNWWDDYYATFTNEYIGSDGSVASAKLPHYFDLSAQLSHSTHIEHLDVTFRIDVNNILNRSDNFLKAQYTADLTRNDALRGRFHWYVLQAPLFNLFLTTEIHFP